MPTWWTQDSLSVIANVTGLVGFVVSIVTLLRVTRVRTAQREERRLLRELYGLDALSTILSEAGEQLTNAGNANPDIVNRLNQMLGRVDGINRALAIAAPDMTPSDSDVRLISGNYYVDEFLINACTEARACIDLLVFRNQQISNAFILDALVSASKRVPVRILAISSRASETALTAALAVMPRPVPGSTVQLKRQLEQNERTILDFLDGEDSHNVSYFGYDTPPLVHFLRLDKEVRMGLVNTLAAAQPARLVDRPYFSLGTDSAAGQILTAHFEALLNDAMPLGELVSRQEP